MRHLPQKATVLGFVGLAILLLTSGHVSAQEPGLAPTWYPQWLGDVEDNSMQLSPTTAKLILGSTSSIHMQLDQHTVGVRGSTPDAFGPLYLQHKGGPIVAHGSEPLASRLYVTSGGDLGVATSNPRQFAVDREFVSGHWAEPPGAIAVDGDIYADQVYALDLDILDTVTIGRPTHPSVRGAAYDTLHVDSIVQIAGKLSAQEIAVHIDNWADNVFSPNYWLMPLDELEAYIGENGHLPEVPTQTTVQQEGIDVAEMNRLLLQKVEELTLYTIHQQKQIVELEGRLDALSK